MADLTLSCALIIRAACKSCSVSRILCARKLEERASPIKSKDFPAAPFPLKPAPTLASVAAAEQLRTPSLR